MRYRSLDPATDYELFTREQDRLEKEHMLKKISDPEKMYPIWEEEFVDQFIKAHEREPSGDEIASAWDKLDFEEWAQDWYVNNPGSE